MINKQKSNLITVVIVILLIIWGMYLRYERRLPDLWIDEIRQIDTMKVSFSAMIAQSSLLQVGDHLLIYPFYQWFGDNKWGLAIPHIIITLLGFYLLYILCKKYFKTPWGYIITFSIFSLNYTLIRHAFEIRPYSVLATLSIAAFLITQYIFEKEKPTLVKRILICVFILASLLFHFLSVFILLSCYIYHLLVSRRGVALQDVLLRHLKQYGIALAIALPFLYYFITHSTDARFQHDVFKYSGEGVIPVLKAVFGNLTGRRIFYLLLPGIVINFFLPHKERFKQIIFFFILIILPITALFMVCFYCKYWFIQRLYIWAIPPFIFLLGWSWDSIIVYFEEWR